MPQAPASTETWSASGRPTPAGTETCSASNRPELQPGVPTAGFELETSYSAANHPNHSTVLMIVIQGFQINTILMTHLL